MCAGATCRTGIHHPGRCSLIDGQEMAVAVDDDARHREVRAQPGMPVRAFELAVAMCHRQRTAGQFQFGFQWQVMQHCRAGRRPLVWRIIVAAHGDDAASRLQCREHIGTQDIAGMHSVIAVAHQGGDTFVELTVGIGDDGDS